MDSVETGPRSVRDIENLWIPMSDGTRLAARMWLPDDAEVDPVPAIIEYIPYRKRDGTRERDEAMYPWFAGRGYACLRIDMRGSGDSDGLLFDEYTAQEHDDGEEAIAWIAAQRWCTGKVGMMGKSWSGFNAVQIAARRPPALAAVIALHATDDRYGDDVHYRGGCLLTDNPEWSATMQAISVLPPDPEVVGDRWRAMWLERLAAQPFWLSPWIDHQVLDDYWRHGSVNVDYAAITCAVYAIGGWSDSYSNTPFRLAANLTSPWKVLVGPWGHQYLHDGVPGPAIGFLQECCRWWDHWLKGLDTGVMDEPRIRLWMQDSVPPRPHYDERPGRWVAEDVWPSPHVAMMPMMLDRHGLTEEGAGRTALSITSPQTTGRQAGRFCGDGSPGEAPADQRLDDAFSVVFDSEPLSEPREIVGAPVIELEVSADRPAAFLVARICDVAPDGASTRVCWGVLNLTHRSGHDIARPVVPGEPMNVAIELDNIAHSFPPGHRIRLALSTAYWPIVWPSPEPATVTVHTGRSRLLLPVRTPQPADDRLVAFEPPIRARWGSVTRLADAGGRRTVEVDLATGTITTRVVSGGDGDTGQGVVMFDDIDLGQREAFEYTYTIHPDDPLSAAVVFAMVCEQWRGDWRIRIDSEVRMHATVDSFVVAAEVDAYEGEQCVSQRRWHEVVPRRGV